MLNTIFNQTFSQTFNKCLAISATTALLLLSQVTFAQSLTKLAQVSVSSGKQKHSLAEQKNTLLESQASSKAGSRALVHKGMSRIQVSKARQQKAKGIETTSFQNRGVENTLSFHHSFSIYTAYSELISDIDEDGYYQSFSVTFDADLLSSMPNEQALVYADLYLSQNGGPWVLYFSTDDFLITGEDTEDEFEVVTQLDSGYVPDNYDVLIDLYEVGYSDVVATFSSNDSNELYALPLESSDYDPEYIEVVYHEVHSGNMSWLLLFSALLSLIYRFRFVKL